MTTITSNGRALAILAGAAFTYGGLRIILGDQLTDPTQWTTSVQLTVLMVGGTIAAGHLMRDAWKDKHRAAAFGFLVLFLSGTGLVVFNSVGRQAEAHMMTEAQVMDVAERKAALKADLQINNDMAKDARRKLGKECETGDGTACKGKRATLKVYEDAVAGVEAKLAALGPQKPVNAKATEGAKIAAVFGADEAKAKAALLLLEPFFWCLFFEFGSIVSLGFAFRHRAITETLPSKDLDEYIDRYYKATANDPEPPLPATEAIETELVGAKIIEWGEQFKTKYGRAPKLPEIQAAFPTVSRSTCNRRRLAVA
jgi:hypothetical protein